MCTVTTIPKATLLYCIVSLTGQCCGLKCLRSTLFKGQAVCALLKSGRVQLSETLQHFYGDGGPSITLCVLVSVKPPSAHNS